MGETRPGESLERQNNTGPFDNVTNVKRASLALSTAPPGFRRPIVVKRENGLHPMVALGTGYLCSASAQRACALLSCSLLHLFLRPAQTLLPGCRCRPNTALVRVRQAI